MKIILILGHIRSGSSLLQHLLISNPQITGFGENHMSYEGFEDFTQLACNTLWCLRTLRMPETYWVDKIVHLRSFNISERILKDNNVFTVFMVRDPLASIQSIFKNSTDVLPVSIQYYSEMMNELECYGRLIPDKKHGFFLTYDQLLNETDTVLTGLSQYLKLDPPLDDTYDLLPTTGKSSYGDWSENIKSGKIVKLPGDHSIKIPDESIAPAAAAYNRCRMTLKTYCTHIVS
jgi:hypothetical protein